MNSEMTKLIRQVKEQGFEVDLTQNSHVRFKPPIVGAAQVISTRTPSGRDLANLKADLARVGFMSEEDLKRAERRLKKIRKLQADKLSPEILKAAAKEPVVRNMLTLPPTLVDEDFEILSRGLSEEIVDMGYYDRFLKGDIDEEPFTQVSTKCKKCPKTFNTFFARLKHQERCGEPEPRTKGEGELPMADRVKCPACDRDFHKTNVTARLNHMISMHDLTECPSCCKVMKPSSLDKHIENSCPVVNRGHKGPVIRARGRGPSTARPPLPDTDPFKEESVATVVIEKPTPAPVQAPEPVSPPPTPIVAAPVAPPAAPNPPTQSAALETDDDTLWALLEMVIDGPVMFDRETVTTVNKWMDATRELRELVSRKRSSN